jgi:hypothetical protein
MILDLLIARILILVAHVLERLQRLNGWVPSLVYSKSALLQKLMFQILKIYGAEQRMPILIIITQELFTVDEAVERPGFILRDY